MESYEALVERMERRYEELAGFPPRYASDTAIRIRVLAGEIYSCMAAVERLKKQKSPYTAEGAELESLARERGIFRREALKAGGKLRFSILSPSWYDMEIPAGTVCSVKGEDGARYITLQAAALPQGSTYVDVEAEAELPGEGGNAAAKTVTELVTVPAGIEGVTNPSAFSGGEDAEPDESLRRRLLQMIEYPPQGGNLSYYRRLVMEHPAVRSVSAASGASGGGTVEICIDGRGTGIGEGDLEAIRRELEEKREIGVTLAVSAAERVKIPVKAALSLQPGWSLERASEVCRKAAAEFFSSMEVGQKFYASALAAALMGTGAVWNVEFDGETTADTEISRKQAAVCGEIVFEEAGA